MPGGRLASVRSGDHAELVAQSILSTVAFTTLVPRTEDVGHDLLCVLAEPRNNMIHAGPSFTVQVKTSVAPIVYEQPHEVKWLEDQDVPLLVGVVTRSDLRLDLYSTWRRVDAVLGSEKAARYKLSPGVIGGVQFDDRTRTKTIPLGAPFLSATLNKVVQTDEAQALLPVLRRWLSIDQENITNARAGVYWTTGPARYTTNDTDFEALVQAFYVNAKNIPQTLRLCARAAASLRIELEHRGPGEESTAAHKAQIGALDDLLRVFSSHVEECAKGLLREHAKLDLVPPGSTPRTRRTSSTDDANTAKRPSHPMNKPGRDSESKWRLLELVNPSSALDLHRVIVFERVDRTDTPPRVWCQGLVDQEQWTQVDADRLHSQIRINLPPTGFEGLPGRMLIDCPADQTVGSRWPLRAEDGKRVLAPLVLKRVIAQTAADLERTEAFYRRGGTAPPRGPRATSAQGKGNGNA